MKPHSHDIELSAGCGRRQHAPNRRPSRRAAPPPSNRRSPGGDERGVEAVVGAILLFALVVLMISIVQVSAVPAWNQQIEFEHSQRVQDDAGDLDAAISRVLSTGTGEAVSVELGTRYPPRAFLLNPPSVSGTLDSRDLGTITISNVQALDPEADDYWRSPGAGSYDTNVVVYDPNYNEYRNPPMVVFEHSALYSEFDGGEVIPVDSGQLVNGNRITIVTLDGDYSAAQVEPASVEVVPLSAPAKGLGVTDTGANVTITIASRLDAGQWTELLSDELIENGGNVVGITDVGTGQVAIELRGGVTYSLRMAKVGIGTGTTETTASYLTTPGGQAGSIAENTTGTFVVEIRDEFNNPVSHDGTVSVTLVNDSNLAGAHEISAQGQTATGGGTLTDLRPDQNGQVTIAYALSDFNGPDIGAQIRASIDDPTRASFAPRSPRDVVLNFTAVNSDRSGVGGTGADINPRGPDDVWLVSSNIVSLGNDVRNAGGFGVVDATWYNNGTTKNITEIRINTYNVGPISFLSKYRNTPPQRVVIENVDDGGTMNVPIPGDYVPVTLRPPSDAWTLEGNGTEEFRLEFQFRTEAWDTFDVEQGDSILLTFVFSDGTTGTYLLAPTVPPPPGRQNN